MKVQTASPPGLEVRGLKRLIVGLVWVALLGRGAVDYWEILPRSREYRKGSMRMYTVERCNHTRDNQLFHVSQYTNYQYCYVSRGHNSINILYLPSS